jgi:hypothetical protein
MRIFRIVPRIVRYFKSRRGSLGVNDQALIESFTSDPDFPYLISFPRTGSHWLRMLMELYFKKPSLIRIFYYKKARDFTCYHHHDVDLELERKNVIYLYREPIDTIYSQLKFYKEDTSDRDRVRHWTEVYGKHLKKWLLDDGITDKKSVLTYEGMKRDLPAEFEKVCKHLGEGFSADRIVQVAGKVSKEKLKKKTKHDTRVVDLEKQYEQMRESFRTENGAYIMEILEKMDSGIPGLFS